MRYCLLFCILFLLRFNSKSSCGGSGERDRLADRDGVRLLLRLGLERADECERDREERGGDLGLGFLTPGDAALLRLREEERLVFAANGLRGFLATELFFSCPFCAGFESRDAERLRFGEAGLGGGLALRFSTERDRDLRLRLRELSLRFCRDLERDFCRLALRSRERDLRLLRSGERRLGDLELRLRSFSLEPFRRRCGELRSREDLSLWTDLSLERLRGDLVLSA